MMKSTRLKCSGVRMCLGEAVFPEAHPAFNRKFQIIRRAEQMQMIGHQEIIAHEPRRCSVLPDAMQSSLNRGLYQPALALLGANREKNPTRSAERNVNAFGRRAATGVAEGSFAHGDFLTQCRRTGKIFRMGRAAVLPYQIKSRVGRRCRAAQNSLSHVISKTERRPNWSHSRLLE
jgi:hypothetical protein